MNKEKIYETLIKLNAKKPLFNITISEISKESKISVGSIYHAFTNKEEIINEAYMFYKTELMNNLTIEDNPNKEVVLRIILENFLAYGLKNIDVINFIYSHDVSKYITDENKKETKKLFQRHVLILNSNQLEARISATIIIGSMIEFILKENNKTKELENILVDKLIKLVLVN